MGDIETARCKCGCGEQVRYNTLTGEPNDYADNHAPRGMAMSRLGLTVPPDAHSAMCEEFAQSVEWTTSVGYRNDQRQVPVTATHDRIRSAVNTALRVAVNSPTFRRIALSQVIEQPHNHHSDLSEGA